MSSKNIKQATYYLGVIIIGVAFGFALQFVQAAFQEPGDMGVVFPQNVDAPLNVGTATQTILGGKTLKMGSTGFNTLFIQGGLGVDGAFRGYSNAIFDGTVTASGLRMTTGAGAGKVLTSDVSGNASWQSNLNINSLSATGDVMGSRLCIGADCKTAWPSGGGTPISSGIYGYGVTSAVSCSGSRIVACYISCTQAIAPVYIAGLACACPSGYTIVCLKGECKNSRGMYTEVGVSGTTGTYACLKN